MHTSPLILLPGSLCDQRLWWHQLAELSSNAAIMVGDLTRDDTIASMAHRVLATAPPRFALAGLSLGGIVALEIIRQAPERVQRLALLATSARPSNFEQRARWQQLSAIVRAGQLRTVVREFLLPTLVDPNRRADAWLARIIMDMADTVGSEAYLRQLAALSTRADSRPYLRQIACPTLLVAGREDPICPVSLHEEMATEVPGARLVIMEQCGHLSSLEHPHTITALLNDWLHRGSEVEGKCNAT